MPTEEQQKELRDAIAKAEQLDATARAEISRLRTAGLVQQADAAERERKAASDRLALLKRAYGA